MNRKVDWLATEVFLTFSTVLSDIVHFWVHHLQRTRSHNSSIAQSGGFQSATAT